MDKKSDIKAAIEALRPFANQIDAFGPDDSLADDTLAYATLGDFRRAKAAIALLERASEQDGWQAIDKAPKDGTKVDLWVVGRHGAAERFPDAFWSVKETKPFPNVTIPPGWRSPYNGWDYEPGGVGFDGDRVTHFMPLPPPPADGGA